MLSDTKLEQSRGNGRKVLLILAIIFLLPFTVAAVMHLLNFKPGGHSYGDLINPPKPLHIPVLQDTQGKPFSAQQWGKKWSIVTIATSCTEACHAQLNSLQQVHVSLGKESNRVQRVLLIPAEINKDAALDLQKNYPKLIVLAGSDAETANFAQTFGLPQAEETGRIYLVDPLGNLMMSYSQGPENLDLKGLRKDLTRLLKNSWAG